MNIRPFHRTIRRRYEPHGTPNATKMERWLGADNVKSLSAQFKNWYGTPVALGGVPGNVYVTGGGEFIGRIDAGAELTHEDMYAGLMRREMRRRFAHATHQAGAFGSLSALIAARTGGKGSDIYYAKTGVAASATSGSMDLWSTAGQPAAGSAGAALPGGTATTSGTAGAWGFVNAVVNANTSHHLGGFCVGSVAQNSLLLIDQLLRGAITMASTATQSVTGTQSRYNSTTAGATNYAGGNFVFPSNPTTVLAATAHNWTVCQYTNQGGTTGQSFPSATGLSACPVHQIDLAVGPTSWFMPLASGDTGVLQLTQIQCSASVATGTIDFVLAHPLAMYPVWIASQACLIDSITTAIDQLANVFDSACLSALELVKPSTTACTYTGRASFCSE